MADAKLNMSLDQIIESSRKPRESKPRPSARKQIDKKKLAAYVPKPTGITKRAPVTAKSLKVSIVNRPTPRRNLERTTTGRHPATRAQIPGSQFPRSRPSGPTRPAPDGRWQHDLYENSEHRPRRQPTTKVDGTKLMISNLDYRVTEDDIKELFSSVGPLKSWKIDYDNSGRSEGTAEIVYPNQSDAEKAKRQYNNVALDGKKMVIEIVSQSAAAGSSVFSRLSTGASRGAGRSGLQVTRTFVQATRDSSARGAKSRASGRMRAFEGESDYMSE